VEFVKLIASHSGRYSYSGGSNIAMDILGSFLASDVYHPSSYIEFAFNDCEECTSSNITALEKENGYILLTDLYSEEKIPTVLKMTQNQFVQILTDWEKILKLKPKEVIIKHENDQFVIETKD